MAYSEGLLARSLKLQNECLIKNINFNENDEMIECGANNGDFFYVLTKKLIIQL
jgi:hypothetical protein